MEYTKGDRVEIINGIYSGRHGTIVATYRDEPLGRFADGIYIEVKIHIDGEPNNNFILYEEAYKNIRKIAE